MQRKYISPLIYNDTPKALPRMRAPDIPYWAPAEFENAVRELSLKCFQPPWLLKPGRAGIEPSPDLLMINAQYQ